MNRLRTLIATLGFVAASALAPVASADVLRLQISDNVGSGFDVDVTNVTPGLVVYNGAVGAWLVNVVTGLGTGVLPAGMIDLNSVNVSSGSGGHLTIVLTQTGTNLGTGPGVLNFLNAIGGTLGAGAGNHIDWSASLDGTTGCAGTFNGAGSAFASNCGFSGAIADLGNFAMSLVIDIYHTNLAVTSFDNSGTVVPEPGVLLLLGAGLIGIGFVRRRKSA